MKYIYTLEEKIDMVEYVMEGAIDKVRSLRKREEKKKYEMFAELMHQVKESLKELKKLKSIKDEPQQRTA